MRAISFFSSRFWKDIGGLISKIDLKDAAVHIMGCNVAGDQQGQQVDSILITVCKGTLNSCRI